MNKKVQPKTAAEVTQAIIDNWKIDNPRGVWKVSVNTNNQIGIENKVKVYEQKHGYLRKPTRMELSATMSVSSSAPVLEVAEGLLRDCWLGGDEEMLEDDDLFQATLAQFQELMQISGGEIKKL